MKQSHRENLIVIAALCGFSIYLVLGILHHEAWRDEWQAINIARSATSLSDLYSRLSYEGHPALWYLCIRAVWEIYPSLLSVQIINCCFAVAAAGLVASFSLWPLWLRLLIAFTGPTAWEYSVKVRSYGLGWLIIVILALVLRRMESRSQGWIVVLLAILALNTSLFTGFVAFSLLAGWLWGKLRTKSIKLIIPQLIILVIAALGTFWLSLPSSDALIGQSSQAVAHSSLISNIEELFFTLFPQADLDGVSVLGISFFFSAILILCFKYLCANSSGRVALTCGWLSIYGFLSQTTLDGPWHYWHLFLVPIAVAIAFEHRVTIPRTTLLLLTVIAFVGFNRGVQDYCNDWNNPYSAAQKTAQAISAAGLDNLPIVVFPGYYISSLSGYLGRPLYDDTCSGEITYIVWRTNSLRQDFNFSCAIQLAKTNPMHKCLVTFNTPLPENAITAIKSLPMIEISLLGSYLVEDSSTNKLSLTGENFYVYVLTDTHPR